MKWLEKAHAAGDPQAFNDLTENYERGFLAPPRSAAKAHALRLQLAQDGVVQAERDVGLDFLRGQGTAVDYAQALSWSQKASDAGDDQAPANLGYLYGQGLGVPQDDAKSLDEYKLSAQRGYRGTQLFLAMLYRVGMFGAEKDPVQAQQYYAMASEGMMRNLAEMAEVMKETIDGHKVYPRSAAAAKQGGLVTVEFDCPARTAENVRVTKSSGYPLLDAAAREAVLDSTFPERDPSLNEQRHFKIEMKFDPTLSPLPIGP